jgi:hypothetical protein
MKKFALFALFALAAVGCSSGYQPRSIQDNSYVRIDQDIFQVSFRGKGSEEKVKEQALIRASELTLQNGYRYFSILEKKDISKKRLESDGGWIRGNGALNATKYPGIELMVKCLRTPNDYAYDAEAYIKMHS